MSAGEASSVPATATQPKRGRIAANISYLFVSDIVVRSVSAGSSLLVARWLGPDRFGVLALALSYGALASFLADLGLTHTFIREGSRGSELEGLVASTLRIRMILAAGATALLTSAMVFTMEAGEARTASIIIVASLIIGGTFQSLGSSYFQATQRMSGLAAIRTTTALLTSTGLLVGLALDFSLTGLALAYGLGSLGAGAMGLILINRYVPLNSGRNRDIWKGLGEFTTSGALGVSFIQLPPVLLSRVGSMADVGIFSAANRFPLFFSQIPSVVTVAFYPALYGIRDPSRHRVLASLELKILAIVGGILSIPGILYPAQIIGTLVGPEWVDGGDEVLRILSPLAFLSAINAGLGDLLTTTDRQRRRVTGIAFGLLILVAAWAAAGSEMSAGRMAAAVLAANVAMSVTFTLSSPHGVLHVVRSLLRSLSTFAGTVWLFLAFGSTMNFVLGSLAAVVSYTVCTISIDKDLRLPVVRMLGKIRTA